MKVYFSSRYRGGHKREHAGKELPVNQEFEWAGRLWRIPAIYSCSKGLVVDFCIRIPREQIEEYIKEWKLEQGIAGLTKEQRERLHQEDPLELEFDAEARINGKECRPSGSWAVSWQPCDAMREQDESVQEEFLDYYACDRSYGWRFVRTYYPWVTARRPKLKTLSLLLKERPAAYPGEHFTTEEFHGRREIEFIHPVSKQKHRLLLSQCESSFVPETSIRFPGNMRYPNQFKILTYCVVPELSRKEFQIRDCSEGDRPREKENSAEPGGTSVTSIGIIGGADGPTAILLGQNGTEEQKSYTAYSALHFSPVPTVEWRMVFYVKEHEDICREVMLQHIALTWLGPV